MNATEQQDKVKKLVKMTEFVRLHECGNDNQWVNNVCDYAGLLRKPLELGMFIPCKDGEPMDKPKSFQNDYNGNHVQFELEKMLRKEWLKALESVLFEGWEIKLELSYGIKIGTKYMEAPVGVLFCKDKSIRFGDHHLKTIEDLITSGIELIPTEACKKLIGLT